MNHKENIIAGSILVVGVSIGLAIFLPELRNSSDWRGTLENVLEKTDAEKEIIQKRDYAAETRQREIDSLITVWKEFVPLDTKEWHTYADSEYQTRFSFKHPGYVNVSSDGMEMTRSGGGIWGPENFYTIRLYEWKNKDNLYNAEGELLLGDTLTFSSGEEVEVYIKVHEDSFRISTGSLALEGDVFVSAYVDAPLSRIGSYPDVLNEVHTILASIESVPAKSVYLVEDNGIAGECGEDKRIVYFNTRGEKEIIEESVASLFDNPRGICAGRVSVITYFQEEREIVFSGAIYEGGGPLGGAFYKYTVSSRELSFMDVNRYRGGGVDADSPSGRYVASVLYSTESVQDDTYGRRTEISAQQMRVLDLLTDTAFIVIDLQNDSETLVHSNDAYGPWPSYAWVGDNTIRYPVFDKTILGVSTLGHPFKERREVSF